MITKKLEINSTDVFTDDVEFSVLDSGPNSDLVCIDNLTIQFEVTVTNVKGETRDFTIAFQSVERNNGMMAYNGYDIACATFYGYDADESEELELFMDYDDCFIEDLYDKAKTISKDTLETLKD